MPALALSSIRFRRNVSRPVSHATTCVVSKLSRWIPGADPRSFRTSDAGGRRSRRRQLPVRRTRQASGPRRSILICHGRRPGVVAAVPVEVGWVTGGFCSAERGPVKNDARGRAGARPRELRERFDLTAGTVLTTTESGRAAAMIARELPGQPVSFDLIFSSRTLRATDAGFRAEVERALAPLRADARVARIRTAYDTEPPDPAHLSRDGRRTRAVVELKQRASGPTSLEFSSIPPEVYASLRRLVRST